MNDKRPPLDFDAIKVQLNLLTNKQKKAYSISVPAKSGVGIGVPYMFNGHTTAPCAVFSYDTSPCLMVGLVGVSLTRREPLTRYANPASPATLKLAFFGGGLSQSIHHACHIYFSIATPVQTRYTFCKVLQTPYKQRILLCLANLFLPITLACPAYAWASVSYGQDEPIREDGCTTVCVFCTSCPPLATNKGQISQTGVISNV